MLKREREREREKESALAVFVYMFSIGLGPNLKHFLFISVFFLCPYFVVYFTKAPFTFYIFLVTAKLENIYLNPRHFFATKKERKKKSLVFCGYVFDGLLD